MAVKKIGISHDLIIHPGETIAEILIERGISQVELATRTGVSAAYVSKVIAGKKDISAKFAMGLEYALEVPKSFWLNLQANYDAELLELNEELSITEGERDVREQLMEVIKYLRQNRALPEHESKDASILSLRKCLQISNLENLKDIVPSGAFRLASAQRVNPYVLGAWVRLCQIAGDNQSIESKFDISQVDHLVTELKQIMVDNSVNLQKDLREIMGKYGIDFSVMKNFRGASVQGYISEKKDGRYQMVLTIRGAFADIFWFSLFHELGHIINGDVGKNVKFIDYGNDMEREDAADVFARNALLEEKSYERFLEMKDFSIHAIKHYADSQKVQPYIVIGRLQKEKYLDYRNYNEYKLRYKWAK